MQMKGWTFVEDSFEPCSIQFFISYGNKDASYFV